MADAVTVDAGEDAATRPIRMIVLLRLLATACLVVTVIGGAVLLGIMVALPADRVEKLNSSVAMALMAVGMTGLAAAAFALIRKDPRSVIAWLMLTTALAWMISRMDLAAALWLLDTRSGLAPFLGWTTNWLWVPAHVLSLLMLLRFPTGRLPSPRWRPVELVVLVWAAVTVLVTALVPGPLGAEVLSPLTNPIGWDGLGGVGDGVLTALFLLLQVLIIVAAAAPIVRWRRAGSRERGALRWIALATAGVALSAPLALLTETGEVLAGVAFLLFPAAIAVAVLRDRLWDLDLAGRYDRLRAAREEERQRLRHELHDSLGPVLGSISMRAEAARNLLDRGEIARANELLTSIGAATEGALDGVRRLIEDLGPAALRDHDLVPALEQELLEYAGSFPVALRVTPNPLPPLDETVAATAFLVVVEAVRNAARHSGGSGATVDLALAGSRLEIEVRDDGRGLCGAATGVGRTAMAMRVARSGGRISIEDGPAGGTVVGLCLEGALR